MGIILIESHPRYNPMRINYTNKLLRLGNAIKRDVSRIMSLSNRESSQKIYEHILNSKKRIFKRLESIAEIRNSIKVQEDTWNKILENILSRVYKHSNTEEIHELFQSLTVVDEQDVSKTGIHFLQAYMRIVARIPEDQIILPFKP